MARAGSLRLRPDLLAAALASALVVIAIAAISVWDASSSHPTGAPIALPTTSAPHVQGAVSNVSEKTQSRVTHAYGKLPLSFIPNKGQIDKSVRYYVQGSGRAFYFTPTKAVLSFSDQKRGIALDLTPLGANPRTKLEPIDRAPGTVNYLTGSDHHTSLPTYGGIAYRNLWPGIDLVFKGRSGSLKYEFHVKPGADPSKVRLAYRGADALAIGQAGNLLIQTPVGTLRDSRPHSFQRADGKRVPVRSRYRLNEGGSAYSFGLGAYDSNRPLVIDPGLAYSTYLGGVADDIGRAIAIDASGSTYVTGSTGSLDFPTTPGAFDTSACSGTPLCDAFVSKLNASGSALIYSTYLGGGGPDFGTGIAVDGSGSAYVTGGTGSSNFPTTAGAFDTSFNGPLLTADAFVTKLNALGSALAYSTFLGSAMDEGGAAVAVDAAGSAYVAGATNSAGFPTTAGAFDTSHNGSDDTFVTKLNASGSALAYSTYVGGSSTDVGRGIAVDGSGSAYVTGETASADFPPTVGAFDTTHNGGSDAFVTELNVSASALVDSTYLGGSSTDVGRGIAVDGSGTPYVTGETGSADFPTTCGAYDTTFNGSKDAFVTKFGPSPVCEVPTSTLIVEKQTEPNADPTKFSFSGDASGEIGDDEQIVRDNLEPGTYRSIESVPQGWELALIVCDDQDSSGDVQSGTATFRLSAGETVTCTFTDRRLNGNPDCSKVSPSPKLLWPPNHKYRLITLSGATDPDSDPVTLAITSVTQDEPLNGLGDGDTAPDAKRAPASNQVYVRAERSGLRDGRVYRIAFTGSDGKGGTCSGTALVGAAPHDQGKGSTPIDSAPPSYNSFGP